MIPQPVGLLAGAGRFPFAVAEKARAAGIPVVCVGLPQMADPGLAEICTEFYPMQRLALGYPSRRFRKSGVRQWTMAGKFHKRLLIESGRWLSLLPDWRAVRFWFFRRRQTGNRDDALLLGLIAEYATDGLECVPQVELCPELLVKPGLLTHRGPSERESRDIEFGWALAREMGRLDVGQSVMIREQAVLAVEAIEGTDEAIRRAGQLCKSAPFVVVKVAKPEQDLRFDVPTVGVDTIETMRKTGARVLAIEAERTILLDEAETIERANRYGLTIISRSGQ
jgi:hypothetical protein